MSTAPLLTQAPPLRLTRWALLSLISLASTPLSASPSSSSLWFSVSVDGGPARYSRSLALLSAWVRSAEGGCLSELRSGDAITITRLTTSSDIGAECHVSVQRMSGRALLAFGLPLDLNQATSEELTLIKGIGPQLASRIISGRPWPSTSALKGVKGVGVRLLKRISSQLSVTLPPAIKLGEGSSRE